MPHLSNMQGLDTDVAGLLRDLADFLECLGEAELSEEHQSAREALLARSRAALERGLDSPEPYLDMSAGKSLIFASSTTDETDQAQEYVNAEARQAQRASLQHYYETFQVFQGDAASGKGINYKSNGQSGALRDLDDVILLYAGFSASQAKSKAAKSGTLLHLKRERKMFAPFNVFWLNRSCWVSLVGSHLLLYGNERDSRPYLVLPLAGYKSRPAPNALPRDPRRGEAAFEIYCPGERTFQFAAKSGQEMREWVDAVTDSLEPEAKKNRATTFVEILELESNQRICIERVKEEREKYQDVVLGSPKTKAKEKQSNGRVAPVLEKEKSEEPKVDLAPALPARTRRLPSLPSQEQIAYEPREELYDEEGLYHRIEDVKAQREYQNCQLLRTPGQPRSKLNQNLAGVDLIQETYDDSEVFVDKSSSQSDEPTETYDDVQSVVHHCANDEPTSYDDVQSTLDCNSRTKDKDNKSTKSTSKTTSQKRSFLDRVRHRKESLTKKDDKKPKSPPPPPSPSATTPPAAEAGSQLDELPCYDEVSNLRATNPREQSVPPSEGELEEEYLSPPPPRPIYSRPPTIIKCALPSDEIYDDIGSELGSAAGCKGCANVDVIKDYPKNGSFLSDLQLSIDREHYQVPRSGNRRVVEPAEEIYDDVTLSESFKSRQRDSPTTTNEKSVWSRLGSGKMRIFDHLARQNSSSEPATDAAAAPATAATEDGEPQHTKVKSLQKLISKMESTLGKANKANGVA